MLSYLSNQIYKTKLPLVELTKQLEREPCDSISFTHRMAKNLLPNASYIGYSASATQYINQSGQTVSINPYTSFNWDYTNSNTLYLSPSSFNNLQLRAIPASYPNSSSDTTLQIKVNNSNGETVYQQYYSSNYAFGDVFYTFSTQEAGTYTLEYIASNGTAGSKYTLNVQFEIELVNAEIPAKPIPSITDVINRILDVGVTRTMSSTPKYRLDPAIAEKFKDLPAPEFFLPRLTLYEALLAVGGYIHGVPRLVWNETTDLPDTITYDLLGLNEVYELPSNARIIGYRRKHSGEAYCGALDSYVDNLINTQDPTAGSIIEPCAEGWKTVRSNNGVQIQNDTAVISLERPIYRLVKLEMGYTDGSQTTPIGDITKYVYEKAEYDGLFTEDGSTFPNSVAYALCYQQGSKEIIGLNTTSTSIINLFTNFNKPSIQNIVQNEGKSFGETSFSNLAFRVTYIPMDTLRVRQYKPYTGFQSGNVLYNQQNANTVEANYYGENLKGKIARLGNEEEVYTVNFLGEATLPKIGQIFDNGYIYKIAKQRGRNYVNLSLYITPNFNKLSEYVGLNSNFRLYEVSERQSIDRQINVSRIIDIGSSRSSGSTMITSFGKIRFMQTFAQSDTFLSADQNHTYPVTGAVIRLLDKDGNQIGSNQYLRAVSSYGLGNSLAFSWKFEDNYSAGDKASYVQGVLWKQKKTVPYGSVYGEFYALEYALTPQLFTITGQPYTFTYADQTSSRQSQGNCDNLPILNNAFYAGSHAYGYFSTGLKAGSLINWSNQIAVDKNSSEAIFVTTQYHGQCNRNTIVMGPKLWINNLLVTQPNSSKKAQFYFLTQPLNMLRRTVDLTGAYSPGIYGDNSSVVNIEGSDGVILPVTNNTSNTYVAWAFIDPTDNGLYIGENMTIAPNQQTNKIYFNFY